MFSPKKEPRCCQQYQEPAPVVLENGVYCRNSLIFPPQERLTHTGCMQLSMGGNEAEGVGACWVTSLDSGSYSGLSRNRWGL